MGRNPESGGPMNRTYLIVSNLLLSANSDQKRVQRFWLPPKTDRAAHESNVRQILGGMVGPQTTFHWEDTKNPHAVALGRLGGKAGTGDSKRRNVDPEQARAAVNSRWARKRAAQADRWNKTIKESGDLRVFGTDRISGLQDPVGSNIQELLEMAENEDGLYNDQPVSDSMTVRQLCDWYCDYTWRLAEPAMPGNLAPNVKPE